MGVTISGMTGAGSIRHNNRSFSAANVDRSRTEQNIVFCNEDLKQVYHMVFDEALAAYNAKKTKTRDKIPDYYEHIRQSKQEKLFHEAIFQIGNMSDCGCGTPDGERERVYAIASKRTVRQHAYLSTTLEVRDSFMPAQPKRESRPKLQTRSKRSARSKRAA